MKNRKCRFTTEQASAHKEAVRIRKMTDEQIIAEIEQIQKDADEKAIDKVNEMIRLEVTDDFYSRYGIDIKPLKGKKDELRSIFKSFIYALESQERASKDNKENSIFKSDSARDRFISMLNDAPGLGPATINKIQRYIEEHGIR